MHPHHLTRTSLAFRAGRQLSTIREVTHTQYSKAQRMFGFLSGKDWNVLAVIFERTDLFTVSGQRVKGGDAVKARDGAQGHARTIFWAVFDQKGKFLEGAPGPGAQHVSVETVKKLEKDLRSNRTVQDILKSLETAVANKLAKPLVWIGYPRKAALPPKDAPEE